jgi:hypothetical protein
MWAKRSSWKKVSPLEGYIYFSCSQEQQVMSNKQQTWLHHILLLKRSCRAHFCKRNILPLIGCYIYKLSWWIGLPIWLIHCDKLGTIGNFGDTLKWNTLVGWFNSPSSLYMTQYRRGHKGVKLSFRHFDIFKKYFSQRIFFGVWRKMKHLLKYLRIFYLSKWKFY